MDGMNGSINVRIRLIYISPSQAKIKFIIERMPVTFAVYLFDLCL